jgi:DNA repair ATPase RecN
MTRTAPDVLDKARALARKRAALVAQLAAVNEALTAELRALHDAGVAQHDLIEATGMTRESVRVITRRLSWVRKRPSPAAAEKA